MTRTRAVKAGAIIVLALTATLLASVPAAASHDPSPPYLSSSQPGGHELYGFHHKQVGATTHAWLGLQRRGSDGAYRWWGKAQGDGRTIAAIFSEVVLTASPSTWGPTTTTTGSGSTVYAYGAWHQITDLATVSAKVNVRYIGGRSTGDRCLDSYIIRRGQRAAWGSPRQGC